MKKMDSYKVFKGKCGTPSFSMRYTAEDEELEQLIEPAKEESEETKDTLSEISNEKKTKDSPVLSKVMKRSSSLEEPQGETWKFFTDIKGRITKTVEEKIEEIKSDRMKKKKKLTTGGENSSVSDSEEKSEASTSRGESKDVSIAVSASQATSCKESEEEDQLTEMDISDSTPVRERRFSDFKSKSRKRGSIEMAEEAFEEGDLRPSTTGVSNIQPSLVPRREDIIPTPVSFLLHQWHILLPIVVSIMFAYLPVPKEMIWACIGGVIVLEFRLICDTLGMWPTDTLGSGISTEQSGLFTGSFHIDSVHILPDQIRQLPSSDPETCLHQGWVNEYRDEYRDETYKLRDTVSTWASLRGPLLTLSSPLRPPSRRAFWSEPQHPKIFTHHRLYNLANCTVTLLPQGLTTKRLWSKKYPIYIKLDEDSFVGTTYKDVQDRDSGSKKGSDPPTPLYQTPHDADVASEALDDDKRDSPTFKDNISALRRGEDGSEVSESGEENQPLLKERASDDLVTGVDYTDFVHVSPDLVNRRLFICLFARSDREKEIWFRRLVAAIGYNNCNGVDEIPSNITISDSLYTLKGCRSKLNKSYLDFMYHLAQAMPKTGRRKKRRSKDGYSGSMWFNVFVSRIYYDFIHNPVCMSMLQEKVQRKLSTVKLPGIVEELVVSRLVVEGPGPVVDGWSEPKLDSSGVWADIDISYQGLTSITIDFHINLTGKKKDSLPPSPKRNEEVRSAIYNSSIEDSGESSSDSDYKVDSSQSSAAQSRRQSHSPSVVNRITHKYFNQVAESKLVKKALEGVSSNTHISLIVEVKALVGTLVINIPPPPTNRLWYGFRPKPKLYMKARPVLGETVVSLVNISNWIEKKLYKEFEKILVLPNMDDLVIPLMDRNIPF